MLFQIDETSINDIVNQFQTHVFMFPVATFQPYIACFAYFRNRSWSKHYEREVGHYAPFQLSWAHPTSLWMPLPFQARKRLGNNPFLKSMWKWSMAQVMKQSYTSTIGSPFQSTSDTSFTHLHRGMARVKPCNWLYNLRQNQHHSKLEYLKMLSFRQPVDSLDSHTMCMKASNRWVIPNLQVRPPSPKFVYFPPSGPAIGFVHID